MSKLWDERGIDILGQERRSPLQSREHLVKTLSISLGVGMSLSNLMSGLGWRGVELGRLCLSLGNQESAKQLSARCFWRTCGQIGMYGLDAANAWSSIRRVNPTCRS